MKRIFSLFIVIAFISLPVIAFGQAVEIPCDGPDCNFGHLVELASNIINFLIMLSIPLTVLAFAYAGLLMLTAGGNEGQISKAKGIFWTVLKGFLFILSAWLIVYTITTALLDPDDFTSLLGYIHHYLS